MGFFPQINPSADASFQVMRALNILTGKEKILSSSAKALAVFDSYENTKYFGRMFLIPPVEFL